MPLSPGLRKLTLAVHLTASIGWIGAVAGYLALDVAVASSHDEQALRASYLGMELIVLRVIVPMAVASLVTGVAISLGTKWGLFRHYWVLISLVLTAMATVVLLVETAAIRGFADLARESTVSGTQLESLGSTLVHSIGGMVVLVAILVLNIYKPRGMTAYGWRKMREE